MINKQITTISWIITTKCNLECKHCYTSSSSMESSGPYHGESEIRRAFDNIKSIEPETIILSGGEPFENKDWPLYAQNARRIGSKRVWLCSNGIQVNETLLAQARDAGVTGFAISLQHVHSMKEDEFRGGTHVLSIVELALDMIKREHFDLILEKTILTDDKKVIDDMIRLGIKHKVDTLYFKRLRPLGRAKKLLPKLTPEGNWNLLYYIFGCVMRESGLKIKVDDPLYSIVVQKNMKRLRESPRPMLQRMVRYLREDRYWGCKAGIEWVGIDPEGYVSPCPLMPYADIHIGKVRIGNIFSQPLNAMINESELMTALRKPSSCKGCRDMMRCGGCRASADLREATDPMCSIGPIIELKNTLREGLAITSAQLKSLEMTLPKHSNVWIVMRDLDDFPTDAIFTPHNRILLELGHNLVFFAAEGPRSDNYVKSFLESLGRKAPVEAKWDGRPLRVAQGTVALVLYSSQLDRLQPPFVVLDPVGTNRRVFMDLPWDPPRFHILLDNERAKEVCDSLLHLYEKKLQKVPVSS